MSVDDLLQIFSFSSWEEDLMYTGPDDNVSEEHAYTVLELYIEI